MHPTITQASPSSHIAARLDAAADESPARRGDAAAATQPSTASRDTSHMRARSHLSRFVGRVGELAELELA